MNNTIMRTITVAATYQPLSATELIGSVTISAQPTNSGPVYLKGDDGTDVPWLPGEWHKLVSVNLAEIQLKGTPGDVVTVVGGTW